MLLRQKAIIGLEMVSFQASFDQPQTLLWAKI
jgi:hypothetical protein